MPPSVAIDDGAGTNHPQAPEGQRKGKEQADHTALKHAIMRGELLPPNEVNAAVTASFQRVWSKLLALPSQLAPLVVRGANRSGGATALPPPDDEVHVPSFSTLLGTLHDEDE